MVALALDETFTMFDEILTDFPVIEKIKTIGGKSMLMTIVDSHNGYEAGSSLTELARRVFILLDNQQCISTLEHNMVVVRKIQIGVAYGSIVAGIILSTKVEIVSIRPSSNAERTLASRMASLSNVRVAFTLDAYNSFDTSTRKSLVAISVTVYSSPTKHFRQSYAGVASEFAKSRAKVPWKFTCYRA
ncbi:hypothetical protein HDU76_008120 [Blyttiomyces sp. JEL0837]|nr:hypothetical protein HDU76_008120 [Blyttiomyces sp. JEL0837]